MSNEKREQQMMDAADRYAEEIYKDEPDNFHTDEQECETINDFCAGWRAADKCPHWIPVEERLPEEVSEIHHCSTDVLIGYFANGDNYQTTARYNCKENVWYDADDWGEIDIPTHWMLLPQPPRKEN